MKSPFPGMDPYIEACGFWEDFHHGLIEQVSAHRETRLERVARNFLAAADTDQRHPLVGHDPKRSFGRVGRGGIRVGRRHVERKVTTADAGEIRREHEKIGTVGQQPEPVSGRITTTRLPAPSSFASSIAAAAMAPDEIPTKIPSSLARRREVATACSQVASVVP